MVKEVSELESKLREAGLKVTAPRLKVLETVGQSKHISADEVFNRVVADLPGTSLQTVYGVLASLTDSHLIRKIEPAGSAALYEGDNHDNHHHIVCRNCRKVEDIPCLTGSAPCLHPQDNLGYSVDEAEVLFWGICADCQNSKQLQTA